VAHPDIDMPWFESLTAEKVKTLPEDEELGFLEKRGYHFGCGCDIGIILSVLVSAFGSDPKAIFDGDAVVEVDCPRCGGVYKVDPPTLDAFLEARRADESSGKEE
jgi:redox-regulated HSP33 family molecular chaperone